MPGDCEQDLCDAQAFAEQVVRYDAMLKTAIDSNSPALALHVKQEKAKYEKQQSQLSQKPNRIMQRWLAKKREQDQARVREAIAENRKRRLQAVLEEKDEKKKKLAMASLKLQEEERRRAAERLCLELDFQASDLGQGHPARGNQTHRDNRAQVCTGAATARPLGSDVA